MLWRSWCVSFLTHTSRFWFSKHSNSEVTSLINVFGDHGYYPQKALDILQEGAIITLKVFSQEMTWTFRVQSMCHIFGGVAIQECFDCNTLILTFVWTSCMVHIPIHSIREGLISLSAYPWRFGKSDLWWLHLSSSVSASHWLSWRSHLNSSIMWLQPAGELSSSWRKNTHSLSSRFAARAKVTTRMLGPEGFLQMLLFAKWFPLMSAACLSRFVSHVIVIKVLKINLSVLYLIP